MSPNAMKRKGSQWERDLAELLTKLIRKSIFRRVAGSGALGTIMIEPTLSSDVKGKVESIPQEFKVECKVGYGGATQLTVKKEWFDKVREEAARSFGIPFVACKFSGAREGTRYFIAMDLDVFAGLINKITELHEDLGKAENELQELSYFVEPHAKGASGRRLSSKEMIEEIAFRYKENDRYVDELEDEIAKLGADPNDR